jgi:hypothetical protein
MFEWVHQRRNVDKIVRCPYCVEGAAFRAMFRHTEGHWLICTECGHLAFPSNQLYRCTCRKCTALTLAIEEPEPRSSIPRGLARILKPFRKKAKVTNLMEM